MLALLQLLGWRELERLGTPPPNSTDTQGVSRGPETLNLALFVQATGVLLEKFIGEVLGMAGQNPCDSWSLLG